MTDTLLTNEPGLLGAQGPASSPVSHVIEPPRSWAGINWAEIWHYRELLYFLTWRDIKIRYRQTVLGAAWAVLQPMVTMVIFTFVFGHMAGLDTKTGGIPYPIYVFSGLLAWNFFANSISRCGHSLVGSSNLITKVYFPRLIIPLAAIGAVLVDLAISFVVLIGMMLYYGAAFSWQLVLIPLLLASTMLAAAGVGMLLSSLMVAYRDFQYVVPFLVQIWMYLTPVIYPSSIIPRKWRPLLAVNPLASLIDGFRSAFLARPFDWPRLGIAFVVSALLFVVGAAYFRKVESRFADII
jgi:homopolymeric O-antigen transport system permease protein